MATRTYKTSPATTTITMTTSSSSKKKHITISINNKQLNTKHSALPLSFNLASHCYISVCCCCATRDENAMRCVYVLGCCFFPSFLVFYFISTSKHQPANMFGCFFSTVFKYIIMQNNNIFGEIFQRLCMQICNDAFVLCSTRVFLALHTMCV